MDAMDPRAMGFKVATTTKLANGVMILAFKGGSFGVYKDNVIQGASRDEDWIRKAAAQMVAR